MAFQRRGGFKPGGKKKSSFIRVGNMFKDKPESVPDGAEYRYSTTVSGEYLTPVAEVFAKAEAEGGGVWVSLTKWQPKPGQDTSKNYPVLTVTVAQGQGGSKRIAKAKEDDGLESQDIN